MIDGTITGTKIDEQELRKARRYAHTVFDQTWTTKYQRGQAYSWLARHLRLAARDCHIAVLNLAQCREVVRLVRELQPRFTGTDPYARTFERRRREHVQSN